MKTFLFQGLNACSTINLNRTDRKVVKDIEDTSTVTRYIYIQNINNPVKIFKETAV